MGDAKTLDWAVRLLHGRKGEDVTIDFRGGLISGARVITSLRPRDDRSPLEVDLTAVLRRRISEGFFGTVTAMFRSDGRILDVVIEETLKPPAAAEEASPLKRRRA